MYIQIRLRVSDQSSPEKKAETRVFVEIERDLKNPKFQSTQYTAKIDESISINTVVSVKPSAMRASDEDKKVKMWCQLIWVGSNKSCQFHYPESPSCFQW